MERAVFRDRARLILGFFGVVFFLVIWRLGWLQIVQGTTFRNQASERYLAAGGSTNDRGSIYFQSRSGSLFTAASMRSIYTIAVVPKEVSDPDALWASLVQVIPEMDRISYLESIEKKDDPYEVLAKGIDAQRAEKIKSMKLQGIRTSDSLERYYPGGSLAAHVLGFVGYKGDELAGRYGLEKSYQENLHRSYAELYSNFFAQLFTDIGRSLKSDSERVSGDLITTIEPEVQLMLEQELQILMQKWNPAEAGSIIMDPRTGDIVAMAAVPSFDLNNFSQAQGGTAIYSNPLVQRSYEMGSIVKPLIMAFGLQKGVITPETTYDDKGFVVVADRTIWNFDRKARGSNVTMQTVLTQSLNTGMVYIMNKLDYHEVRDYLKSLGLGSPTGIDLPYEAKGLATNAEKLRQVEYSNIAFGQGIAWTPIQITRALSVIPNRGVLVTPRVVSAIRYSDGFQEEVPRPEPVRVLEPHAAEQVTAMMVRAADTNFGQGGKLFEHYTVAAKTGTAQVASPNGGYSADRKLHSFFGFFPAYEPRFVIFYYLLYPTGAKYSAQTLSGSFIDTVEFLTNYYNVAPDRGVIVEN